MKRLFIFLPALLLALTVQGQVTKNQADSIVLRQVLAPSLINNVDVYRFSQPLSDSDDIQSCWGSTIDAPFQSSWGYFIDLYPFANWSHPCQICFVNTADGSYSITESDLPKELKNLIHSPHSKKFSANPVVTANYKFLNYNLFQIFTIGKEDGKLQRQNEENITKIFEYIEKVGHDNISESLRKIKNFFEMRYEDLIRKFYDSYEFIDFKNDETTIFYDEGVIKQEKFSLLKDYGLIKLFKMIQKKRSRD